ncbi:MAG: LysE family translocator, partial [Deltaproteobacteria bacterium]|nr:LysE family translocator [Deltaproteobacteria bacterium]
MDIGFLLKGLFIGFSIAAPVGPIGLLCIRRTLAEGRTFGLVSGLGAATADAIYGCIAGFGLTFISTLLISQQVWFRVIGGL